MNRRALISVSDKTGLVEFATQLTELNFEIVATSGTVKLLAKAGIKATLVADYTGFPEILGGRVKTLHPKIYGGLLAQANDDQTDLTTHNIPLIDLVVINLYPFQQATARTDCTLAEAIEYIDIGGPTMLRAAAKNAERVSVLVDIADYAPIIEEIRANNNTHLETRWRLARKAFAHTADYDRAIAHYLAKLNHSKAKPTKNNDFPAMLTPNFDKITDLRYGENPHQRAAFYNQTLTQPGTLAAAEQLQGKPLSYNNLLDADAAFECVQNLADQPACVIVKHATPCGAAQAESLVEAYQRAYATDPQSAFGGIVALNRPLDEPTAKAICQQQFVEVIMTPQVHVNALAVCANKPNMRVLTCSINRNNKPNLGMRSISGGLLIQDQDLERITLQDVKCVTNRQASPEELDDLLFAWHVVAFAKSNAIVYAKNCATIGIGSGQTSRVFSARIAILKAQEANLPLAGAVMASDAFFPFADSIDIAANAGITAIIQPGGSKRDTEIIKAANKANIAMVLTGMRHFKH
ncbi:MAG: bifunctional phosphoribosylaminoimidazolecarboxamide formyltransferase/IMP cyclohydrolase [Gammaproteobacteria bacterium]|nr:bifunctional phosphoribosylaminoimidazolecarboxamide formyltransferase/IMP cyclohydrolase [Gammaproteobacteria bacterium]